MMEEPINFVYEDTDTYQNEISELYSYSEEADFLANRNAFEESMEDCGLPLTWKHMVQEQKSRAINYLMTTLEVSCRNTRVKSCRALAYLIQGIFGECLSLEEQASISRENVFLLHQQGIFHAFVQQLLIEANLHYKDSKQHQQAILPSSQIFNDSSELRLILAVLCTITETMYHAKESSDPKVQETRQQFISELQTPIGDELLSVTLFQMLNNYCGGSAPHYPVRKITLLLWKVILITLGGTQALKELKEESRNLVNLEPIGDDTFEVTKNMRPCSPPVMPDGQARAKSTLSAIAAQKRKVFKQPAFDDAVFAYAKECLLNSLAELDQRDMENENSDDINEFELNDSTEMGQSNLGFNSSESNESNMDLFNIERNEPLAISDSNSSEGASSDSGITNDSSSTDKNSEDLADDVDAHSTIAPVQSGVTSVIESNDARYEALLESRKSLIRELPKTNFDSDLEGMSEPTTLEETSTPLINVESPKKDQDDNQVDCNQSDVTSAYKGLPWTPKVRKADLSQHLSNIRQKFLGYTLPKDLETTFGLPDPIIEGISVLKKHLYVSLSEVQLEQEDAIERYPLTHHETNINYRDTAAERFYEALLPKLPQYMIALLKILLAASTSTKNNSERSESINIMSEMNSEVGSASIIQTIKMNADANRHKEVIIKSVSAILILMLKHFKINHIYQFEYISQQLMFANCIPLILKFLSQDIYSYIVSSKSTISAVDFPACVIGEQPELTAEAIELCSFQPYSWRNIFSCINLVKILNKLTKWKHSRIMMLVVFKSAPTLTKALSVRHSMFQLYVLKLLKVQLKFLGRQWKKNNMKLISAIYQKVRHRLTDDWAYSNDNEARPWDFQAEEFTLQANINKFHQRRYKNLINQTNKGRAAFGHHEKFGVLDDCIDEDYDFGLNDINHISPHFGSNYERWLESEVFQRRIDWDKLLGD